MAETTNQEYTIVVVRSSGRGNDINTAGYTANEKTIYHNRTGKKINVVIQSMGQMPIKFQTADGIMIVCNGDNDFVEQSHYNFKSDVPLLFVKTNKDVAEPKLNGTPSRILIVVEDLTNPNKLESCLQNMAETFLSEFQNYVPSEPVKPTTSPAAFYVGIGLGVVAIGAAIAGIVYKFKKSPN